MTALHRTNRPWLCGLGLKLVHYSNLYRVDLVINADNWGTSQ